MVLNPKCCLQLPLRWCHDYPFSTALMSLISFSRRQREQQQFTEGSRACSGSEGQCVLGATPADYKAHPVALLHRRIIHSNTSLQITYFMFSQVRMLVWIWNKNDSLHRSVCTRQAWLLVPEQCFEPGLQSSSCLRHIHQSEVSLRPSVCSLTCILDTVQCDGQLTWNWRKRQEKWLDESRLGVDVRLDIGNRRCDGGRAFEDELVWERVKGSNHRVGGRGGRSKQAAKSEEEWQGRNRQQDDRQGGVWRGREWRTR